MDEMSLLTQRLNGYTVEPLKQAELSGTECYYGFLYNTSFERYVSADSDQKWLYADQEHTADAVLWKINLDSVGHLVLTALLGATVVYFSWRNSTGACKLYDSYDPIKIEWSNSDPTLFEFKSIKANQYIGTWSESDNELYVRKNNCRRTFQFKCIVPDALSKEDRVLFDHFRDKIGL